MRQDKNLIKQAKNGCKNQKINQLFKAIYGILLRFKIGVQMFSF